MSRSYDAGWRHARALQRQRLWLALAARLDARCASFTRSAWDAATESSTRRWMLGRALDAARRSARASERAMLALATISPIRVDGGAS